MTLIDVNLASHDFDIAARLSAERRAQPPLVVILDSECSPLEHLRSAGDVDAAFAAGLIDTDVATSAIDALGRGGSWGVMSAADATAMDQRIAASRVDDEEDDQ